MNMDWILQCFPEYKVLVEFDNIETKEERQEIHGLKERINTRCMFCGKPFELWGKILHMLSQNVWAIKN